MLKLIKRFFEIDYDLLYVNRIKIISRLRYFISIHFQLLVNYFTKKYTFNFLWKKIHSDKLLTIKTFSSTIYDVYWETIGLSIFDKDNPTIIDIWANIWQFAFACKYLLPKSKIISFEPNPETYKILKKNLSWFTDCHIHNIWLANSDDTLDFYVSAESSEWCSFVKPEDWNYTIIHVPVKRWDKILENLDIDLMKIDVEWFEKLVLLGCESILKNIKYMIIECSIWRNSSDIWSKDLLDYIMSNWFVIQNIGRIYWEWFAQNQWAVDITFKNINL